MKPGHLLIGLLTTFLLFTSCSKSPVQEDPLPERYLRSSEVQVIQAHLIKLNTLPAQIMTSENYLPTLLRALDLDEETFQKLLTDSPV